MHLDTVTNLSALATVVVWATVNCESHFLELSKSRIISFMIDICSTFSTTDNRSKSSYHI